MTRPTFLVLGAQKAGTTWITDMLRQHPKICMPEQKELHFFNKQDRYERGIDWYESHFRECGDAPVRGEATPNYLWTSDDPEEIQESGRVSNIPKAVYDAYPDLQFVVSLRDPVDRAVSAYRTLVRGGYISPWTDVLEAVEHYGILSMGDYQKHIERWMEYFPRSNFLFLVFEEDIKRNREEAIKQMYRFLDVSPAFIPDDIDVRKHPSLGSFYETLLYYAPWLRSVANTLVPNMNREHIPFRMLLDRSAVNSSEIESIRQHFVEKNDRLDQIIDRRPEWLGRSARSVPEAS